LLFVLKESVAAPPLFALISSRVRFIRNGLALTFLYAFRKFEIGRKNFFVNLPPSSAADLARD
jgi:hypothetical protein